MTPSDLGKLVFNFLSQHYEKHGITEISCDEDYCTIHVQTSSEESNTIIIRGGICQV